jgi:ribonucleoside-diphosphate reductase alpha chain
LSDAAAELGTYQAGFTSFPYLGEITERIVEKEALLGVSIAGVMHNPAVMLEPAVLQEAARRVRLRNQETADAIGINRAARLTCEKPDGNSACTLGSFSGAHPGKIRRGFRMTQENKGGVPYQFFKSVNPEACEPSCWNPNQTDDVIRFCVEYDGLLEDDMTALEFLGHVRTLRKHWVEAGTVPERCSRPGLTHNVSCTVKVRNHEWGGVAREIFVKQQDFGGVSFISDYGDRDYPQAPFTPVFLPDELLKMYGGHGVVRAGDMVDILPAGPSFRLWDWCDMALGIREKTEEAADWLEQFRQVSEGVFGGDVRRTTYAVKDVFNLRLWQHLRSTYRPVDYTEMKEEVGGVNFQGEISCAAGACET